MSIPDAFIPVVPRVYHKRKSTRPATPVTGPVLVSTAFDYEGPSITLNFDRDIEVGTYDGTQLVIHDGVHTHMSYNGSGGIGSAEGAQIQIYLSDTGAFGGSTSTMTASATTGIREYPEGDAWAGVTSFPV